MLEFINLRISTHMVKFNNKKKDVSYFSNMAFDDPSVMEDELMRRSLGGTRFERILLGPSLHESF